MDVAVAEVATQLSELKPPSSEQPAAADAATERAGRKEGQEIQGTVKRWDVEKGFGFVSCDDGGEDLFIHQSTIKVEGDRYRAVAPGTLVTCIYHVRDGKETVLSCAARDGSAFPGFASKLEATRKLGALASGIMTGSIKFMNSKGFGFIIPDGGGEDIFVHIQDIQGFQMLPPGTSVSFTISTKKGARPQAVQVTPLVAVMPLSPYAPQAFVPSAYPGYGVPYSPVPTYGPPPGELVGAVKWFSPEKGFGFIIPIGGGPDVYFKASDVVSGGPMLSENELVVYDSKIARGDGQTVRAVNVARQSTVMGNRVPMYGGYPTSPRYPYVATAEPFGYLPSYAPRFPYSPHKSYA